MLSQQLLQQEMEKNEHALAARRKLLHDCQALQIQLQECNVKFVDNSFAVDSSSISDVLDLLAESDKQIGLLLSEVCASFSSTTFNLAIQVVVSLIFLALTFQTQRLAPETSTPSDSDDVNMMDHELRVVLRDIVSDNAKLRKQVNSFIRSILQIDSSSNENSDQALPREIVLKQLFDT